MAVLDEAFVSMDALNSWVRSPSSREATSSPYRRIYEAKRMALDDATRLLGARHFKLVVPAECSHCRGTGKYTDWDGRTLDHCWRCSSTGRVRLEFVESHVVDGMRWHTPVEKAYGLSVSGELSFAASDWDVNKPGRDLLPEDAARHLLAIDLAWPPRYPSSHGHCFDRCDCTDRYSLYVGELKDVCAHCGTASPRFRFHKREGRVECTLRACESCYAAHRGVTLFDVDIPTALTQRPYVIDWISRNGRLKAVTE